MNEYSGTRLYQYNEDDFFTILIYIKMLNNMDTHKHSRQKKLQLKKLLFDYL